MPGFTVDSRIGKAKSVCRPIGIQSQNPWTSDLPLARWEAWVAPLHHLRLRFAGAEARTFDDAAQKHRLQRAYGDERLSRWGFLQHV